jgi:hypothetical protein
MVPVLASTTTIDEQLTPQLQRANGVPASEVRPTPGVDGDGLPVAIIRIGEQILFVCKSRFRWHSVEQGLDRKILKPRDALSRYKGACKKESYQNNPHISIEAYRPARSPLEQPRHLIPVGIQRSRPLMVFDATINSSYGR